MGNRDGRFGLVPLAEYASKANESTFIGVQIETASALNAVDEIASAIRQAVEMAPAERQRRMRRLRGTVAGNNVYRWAGKIIHALLNIDPGDLSSSEGEELAAVYAGASP